MDTAEEILTYIGSVFIALEFFRSSKLMAGLEDLQAFFSLICAWPVKGYINNFSLSSRYFKSKGIKLPLAIVLVVYVLLILIILVPSVLLFRTLYLVLAPFEFLHIWINKIYKKSQEEYKPTIRFWTKKILDVQQVPKTVTKEKVMKVMYDREIPILPIIGLVLITTAFVIHF
jgi:hypothetical protein